LHPINISARDARRKLTLPSAWPVVCRAALDSSDVCKTLILFFLAVHEAADETGDFPSGNEMPGSIDHVKLGAIHELADPFPSGFTKPK
jgi:hypothetical protein